MDLYKLNSDKRFLTNIFIHYTVTRKHKTKKYERAKLYFKEDKTEIETNVIFTLIIYFSISTFYFAVMIYYCILNKSCFLPIVTHFINMDKTS